MAGGDYGRVRHTFWTDPDIKRGMSIEQKALLLYYFTSPHSSLIGLYYCPLEYAAVETGLDVARVREWTLGVLAKYVTYDTETEEIFVHRAGRHQVGDELKVGDNRVKAIRKAIGETHSSRLIGKFAEMYSHWPLGIESKKVKNEAPQKPLQSPSEAKAVAVQCSNSAVAGEREDDEAGADPDDEEAKRYRLKVDLEAHGEDHNYGPKERLIVTGDDIAAWRTNGGSLVPWPDRLRLLKLADAHFAQPNSKARDLRSALRYVILQQYDPIEMPKSSDFARSPANGAEPSPVLASGPNDDLDALKAAHPEVYAEALEEMQGYGWWSGAGEVFRRSQIRQAMKERLDASRGAA